MTYFRIQTSDRDTADLLIAENQISESWYGPESYTRNGVSVCDSLESLAFYLANSGIPYGMGEWVIVEVTGERVWDQKPMDAEFGEILIRPNAVISVRPMDQDFFDMIGAEYDKMEGI